MLLELYGKVIKIFYRQRNDVLNMKTGFLFEGYKTIFLLRQEVEQLLNNYNTIS